MENIAVTLARRPSGAPVAEDFEVSVLSSPQLKDGEVRTENLYVSIDAGFRNWMDEGAGDDVLPAMVLGEPVMGLVLGRVCESRNDRLAVGQLVMARLAWEQYSVLGPQDFAVPVAPLGDLPIRYHLGVLGDTGMSAYFGMTDIGRPRPGETVLVSAAAGAVGSIAGQIARNAGARVLGLAGTEEKCRRLVAELGYDEALNHRDPELDRALADACPDGIDVYFDNVGGPLLEVVLEHIAQGARIPFCGAVADYAREANASGPRNLFRLVTQSALLQGFMTHLRVDRYPEARAQLAGWLTAGEIVVPEAIHEGVEQCGVAFADLFAGRNFGKTIVRVHADVD